MKDFVNDSKLTVNAKIFCVSLIKMFYTSMLAIAASKDKDECVTYFSRCSRDAFIEIFEAHKAYSCFDEKISEIMTAVEMLLNNIEKHLNEKECNVYDILTDLQIELYDYIHNN